MAAFAAAREKMEAQQGDKPKDATTSRALQNLTLGLDAKKRRSARHGRQSNSARLPRTRSTVQRWLPIWRWFTRGPASTTARSSNSKKSRPFPDMARHTAISSSIRAGMICAVIRVSTKSSPQPRLPADSRHEFETRSLPCSLAAALADLPSISLIPSARFTNLHQLLRWSPQAV